MPQRPFGGPTTEEAKALGGIGNPGSAANRQAAKQEKADTKRYYEDVAAIDEATIPPGMDPITRGEVKKVNRRAASYGPMDGSKPPAEAFLPREDFEVTQPPKPQKAEPKTGVAATNAYEAALLDVMNRKNVRMAEAQKILAAEGVMAPPGSIVSDLNEEEDAAAVESAMEDGAEERQNARYAAEQQMRLERLRKLGLLPEGTRSGPVDFEKESAAAVAANKEKFGDWRNNPQYAGDPANARRNYMMRIAKRYAKELANGTVNLEDIMAQYDAGIAGAGSPIGAHAAGARSARNLTDVLDARGLAQRQVNVQNAANQINQARIHRVPRGFIAAQQGIDRAIQAGDMERATAMAASYAQLYGPSFAKWASSMNNVLGRQAEADAVVQAAEITAAGKKDAPGGVEQFQRDLAALEQMPPGPGRLAAIRMQSGQSLGQGADPAMVTQEVQNRYQPLAQQLMAKPLDQWTNEERSEFAQIAGKMGYNEFLKYLAMQDSPDSQRIYQDITGVDPTNNQWVPDIVYDYTAGLLPEGAQRYLGLIP